MIDISHSEAQALMSLTEKLGTLAHDKKDRLAPSRMQGRENEVLLATAMIDLFGIFHEWGSDVPATIRKVIHEVQTD